jgi:hypothetical protein
VIRNYHGHLSGVYALALHPTIDILVTGGRDSTARVRRRAAPLGSLPRSAEPPLQVWDMRTKAQIKVLGGHKSTVASIVCQGTDPQVPAHRAAMQAALTPCSGDYWLARLHDAPVGPGQGHDHGDAYEPQEEHPRARHPPHGVSCACSLSPRPGVRAHAAGTRSHRAAPTTSRCGSARTASSFETSRVSAVLHCVRTHKSAARPQLDRQHAGGEPRERARVRR